MNILFYDTECNSLDTQNGFIQELAFGIYNTDSKRFVQAESHLIRWHQEYEVDPKAFETTGLTRQFCNEQGVLFVEAVMRMEEMSVLADKIAGHNIINYDDKMYSSNYLREFSIEPATSRRSRIDTLIDVPYPKSQKVRALKYLALDHGYVLNGAHQALNDVFASAHIFSCYPIEKILEIAATPLIKAAVKTGWDQKIVHAKLKDLGFYFNGENKLWEKTLKEYYVDDVREALEEFAKSDQLSLEIGNV